MVHKKVVNLKNYPIEEINSVCFQYLYQFNWDVISDTICKEKVAFFDVTDALEPFQHLSLDDNYRLYCYVTQEYHGLWGRVAAVRQGASLEPILKGGVFGDTQFEIPDGGVYPSEAIYNDGSPEGYLDAALALEFLSAIPYATFERKNWDNCISGKPKKLDTDWLTIVDLPDWSPRLVYNGKNTPVLYACWRRPENGSGSSDGLDKIYLRTHSFYRGTKEYYRFQYLRQRSTAQPRSMYRTMLDDDSRYSKTKHCCVSSETSILIAEQTPIIRGSLDIERLNLTNNERVVNIRD
ncbi:MAG: hypothetical protein ACOX81_07060 [Candidatus Heteroscillospira sp.]|jgi:hypothetical protein